MGDMQALLVHARKKVSHETVECLLVGTGALKSSLETCEWGGAV
jgi:hypothetical protein